ncbi:S24 family peptidase [Zhengella sp. ZM62]|uniref:S24 family peptidase n=1 Tax=Zhengella sedimenti TaxID=3390035 RepID=UPI003976D9F9
MLSHSGVWAAIDALAERHGLSASGLARRAGLDSTAFNRSKRLSGDGRPRWPSTESIAKILSATGTSLGEFMKLLDAGPAGGYGAPARVPLLGVAQAGAGGFFDDAGFPAGQGLDIVDFPVQPGEGVYALEVQGDSMLPVYRDGDRLIVQPGAQCRKGDRVVVRTRGGEVMAKVLARQGRTELELASLNPDHPPRVLDQGDVDWMARILWASQ